MPRTRLYLVRTYYVGAGDARHRVMRTAEPYYDQNGMISQSILDPREEARDRVEAARMAGVPPDDVDVSVCTRMR